MSKRSVISIHLGQCGVQKGSSLWELYNFEHDIANDGSRSIADPASLGTNIDNFRSFYYETASGKYVPKALFIDSEPSVMDSLRQSSLGSMIHSNFMINSSQDCRNVFGYAWYPTFCGQPFHKLMKNQVRKVRELCDTLSGAMYYLSTSGGSGTGFGARCLEQMRADDQKSVNYAVINTPSVSISGNPMETYNTVAWFGVTRHDNLDMNMQTIFDNEALYRQCNRLIGQKFSATYRHLNQLVAMAMSSMTASLRFDGQLNVDLNELQTNLVPIQTLNNMFCSMAPLDMDEDKESMSTKEVTLQAFAPESYMCCVDPFAFVNKWDPKEDGKLDPWFEDTIHLERQNPWTDEASKIETEMTAELKLVPKDNWTMYHRFIACTVMYRGDLMPATINRAMQHLTQTKDPKFVNWVPSGFKVGINSPPMRTPSSWPIKDMSRSLTCMHNNTAIAEKLIQIVRNYKYIQDLSGYNVWLASGGIEQSLIDNAKAGLVHQINQYEYCMATKRPIADIREILETPVAPLGKF